MARILVVDDDPNSRKIVELMLQSQGYELGFVENGQEAVIEAERQRPDLIFMDMLMPVLDGKQAVALLKQNPRTASIPVVALTALAFASDRKAALEAGCDDYLSKPFMRRELLEMARRYLPAPDRQASA